MAYQPGRHFLQIPGPTNVPDRVLRAIDYPTLDHRGPEAIAIFRRVLETVGQLFGTKEPVIIFPSSGTGAWEAALVNTCSPGDRVLLAETGHFSDLWAGVARGFGLEVEMVPGDWRHPADIEELQRRLEADEHHEIRACLIVHNETSTGVTSRVDLARTALDAAGHPALLMADTVSSVGSIPYEHDAWGVDVTICGSQKGMMLPPGLSFNAVSGKALAATSSAKLPRSYWDWNAMLASNAQGSFPYTPATNLLYGLAEAIDLMNEEGLPAVFARHARHGQATRTAVEAWGLELQSLDTEAHSNVVTTVRVPEDASIDADDLRKIILERFNTSLGAGLSRLAGHTFRIGHIGDFNDPMLLGTLSVVEAGLRASGMPYKPGGAQAALEYLADTQ